MLLAEGPLASRPAHAEDQRFAFDLSPAPLPVSLSRFSAITGISVGYDGALPALVSHRVNGTLTAEKALRKLLEGTRLRALRLSATLYRLEVAPLARRLPVERPVMWAREQDATIVVTGLKRTQSLENAPLSISVMTLDDPRSAARSIASRDVILGIEGLAMTNLGPGRNRQFIRGVADSAFLGQSQSTVAVQVDEARVTFNAPDPDLRLIDVDRVEILKGPQGPLYGSGALGGIYHIVTRRPELGGMSAWARVSGSDADHGGMGSGLEGVVNLPLVEDRLAVRAVGYRFIDGGWIDNLGVAKDSNSTRTTGLRLGVKWLPSDGWSLDAGFATQNIASRDSQYLLQSTGGLRRPGHVPEPTDNDFALLHATLAGELGSMRLLWASSYVRNGYAYGLDATASAADFGLSGPAFFHDDAHYSLFNQELRLSSGETGRWLIGLSYLRAFSRDKSTIRSDGVAPRVVQQSRRVVSESALFGEATLPLSGRLDATLGARLFYSRAEDAAREAGKAPAEEESDKLILSPSLSLSYHPSGGGLVYLRYARAMRPGGLAPSGLTASGHFDADELGTVDLGGRKAFDDNRLQLSGSIYFTQWDEIQSDDLLANGLVTTRNAGRGRIIGMEAGADWDMGSGFSLSLGGSAQSALLTHSAAGVELKDRRLPVIPGLTGRAALSRRYDWMGMKGQATVQANYVGKARLSFDDDLDRKMQPYATVAIISTMQRGPWTAGLHVDNLLDIRGDSFAFGNPFSIRTVRQYTPLRPRTITLSLSRQW